MLRVVGNEHSLDEVKMPSECLHIFKNNHITEKPANDYFWFIKEDEGKRTARLIKKGEMPAMFVGEIVPAYRKG